MTTNPYLLHGEELARAEATCLSGSRPKMSDDALTPKRSEAAAGGRGYSPLNDVIVNLKVEIRRLRKIEHAAWHVCESSEERSKEFSVDKPALKALSQLLPMEHPPHHE